MNYYSLKSYPIENIENSLKLSKIHSDAKNIKSINILDPTNLPPDMMHTLYYNNPYASNFHDLNNPYKLKPHIDYGPIYTPPYYSVRETGASNFDYNSFFGISKK